VKWTWFASAWAVEFEAVLASERTYWQRVLAWMDAEISRMKGGK
jgi:hypothetical protein